MSPGLVLKDIDQQRREIDDEVHRLTISIRELKFRRNSLAGIFKLPSDVLTEIFLLMVPTYPAHQNLDWVRAVTHVCHHWRTIALNMPTLWSYICFDRSKEWTMEMLHRSRDTPLVIRAEISDDSYSRRTKPSTIVCCVRGRIGKIRVLHVTLRGYEDEHVPTYAIPEIITMLHEPSPVLQTLHLHESPLPNKAVSIPPNVFHIQKQLTRLDLINITFDWRELPESLLQRLEHLFVADFRTHSSRANLADVLAALGKMVNLEYLRLTLYALPVLSILPTSSSQHLFPPNVFPRPVRLSKLVELRLKGTLRDISCLIRHLIPPMSNLLIVDIDCLKLHNPMAQLEDMESVLSFVDACFDVGPVHRTLFKKQVASNIPLPLLPEGTSPHSSQTKPIQPLRRLVITDHAGDIFQPHLVFMGWTSVTGFNGNSRAQMSISFTWDTDTGRSMVPGMLTTVCGSLSLRRVQSLVVEYSQIIPRGLWTELFMQMREVRSLSLYGEKAALELPLALIPPEMCGIGANGEFGGAELSYLPKLSSLEITRIGYSRKDPLLFQRLRDCLSEREVGNVGVQHITIYGWKDTESELISQLEDMGVKTGTDPDA